MWGKGFAVWLLLVTFMAGIVVGDRMATVGCEKKMQYNPGKAEFKGCE